MHYINLKETMIKTHNLLKNYDKWYIQPRRGMKIWQITEIVFSEGKNLVYKTEQVNFLNNVLHNEYIAEYVLNPKCMRIIGSVKAVTKLAVEYNYKNIFLASLELLADFWSWHKENDYRENFIAYNKIIKSNETTCHKINQESEYELLSYHIPENVLKPMVNTLLSDFNQMKFLWDVFFSTNLYLGAAHNKYIRDNLYEQAIEISGANCTISDIINDEL